MSSSAAVRLYLDKSAISDDAALSELSSRYLERADEGSEFVLDSWMNDLVFAITHPASHNKCLELLTMILKDEQKEWTTIIESAMRALDASSAVTSQAMKLGMVLLGFVTNKAASVDVLKQDTLLKSIILWIGKSCNAMRADQKRHWMNKVSLCLCKYKHNLSDIFVSVWNSESSVRVVLASLYPVLSKSKRISNETLVSIRQILIEVYKTELLTSKSLSKISRTHMDQLSLFLTTLSAAEWHTKRDEDESLESQCIKLLKKSPESSCHLMASMTTALSCEVDLTLLINEAASSAVFRMLKSSDEAVRDSGAYFLVELMRRCNSDTFCTLLRDLFKMTSDRVPSITTAIRIRLAACLAKGADTASSKASTLHNADCIIKPAEVLVALCKCIDKETDKGCNMLLGNALAQWLLFYMKDVDFSAALAGLFSSGITKAVSSSAYLFCLSVMADHLPQDQLSLLSPFLDAFMTIVSKGSASIATDATLSLYIVSKVSESHFKDKAVWKSIRLSNSFLNAPVHYPPSMEVSETTLQSDGLTLLNDTLARCRASICGQVLVGEKADEIIAMYIESENEGKPFEMSILSSMVALIMHPHVSVRNHAIMTLQGVQTSKPDFNLALLKHIPDYLEHIYSTVGSDAYYKAIPTNRASNSLLKTIAQIPCEDEYMSPAVVCQILTVCCHPLVAGSTPKALANWQSTCAKSPLLRERCGMIELEDEEVWDKFTIAVSSDVAPLSASHFDSEPTLKSQCASTIFSFISACSIDAKEEEWATVVWEYVFAQLIDSVQALDMLNISKDDLQVYNEHLLSTAIEEKARLTEQLEEAKASQPKSETDFLARIKKDKKHSTDDKTAAGKKGKGKQDAIAEHENGASEIIASVQKKVNDTKALFRCFLLLLSHNQDQARQQFQLLFPLVIQLYKCDLIADDANTFMQGVVRVVLDTALEGSSLELYRAIYFIATLHKNKAVLAAKAANRVGGMRNKKSVVAGMNDIPSQVISILDKVFELLQTGFHVQSYTCSYVFPLIKYMLEQKVNTRKQLNTVMMILEDFKSSLVNDDLCTYAMLYLIPEALSLVLQLVNKEEQSNEMRMNAVDITREILRIGLSNDIDVSVISGSTGILSSREDVRLACVLLLEDALKKVDPESVTVEENLFFTKYIWILRADSNKDLKEAARRCWKMWPYFIGEEYHLTQESFFEASASFFEIDCEPVRDAAARSVAEGILVFGPEELAKTGAALKEAYCEALSNDTEGVANEQREECERTRVCVALALKAIGEDVLETLADSGDMMEKQLFAMIQFLSSMGVVDPAQQVRTAMLDAGKKLIDKSGARYVDQLMAFFEKELKRGPSKDESIDVHDDRHEALVVLLGTAGKYIAKDDFDRKLNVLNVMVEELKTPSAAVQENAADCLVPLVQPIKDQEICKTTLNALVSTVMEGESYGDRRGAALGMASFVKGMGISVLKQFDIITTLKEGCEKGGVTTKQGSLSAFECLSARLAFLFEPYVVMVFPILLKSLSHSNDHVRDAAKNALQVIMSKMSAHGMRQVLAPILTDGLSESQWKTRQEAMRVLGNVCVCAPKQIGSSLPQIVPRIVESLSDPHPKVKDSAKQALNDLTSTIKNPELSRLSDVLLGALSDPANKTKAALEALLQCEFVHSIDSPSLAVLIPILTRALKDRGADLKRRSAAITGNIVSMVNNSKDILPYLAQILPGLKECLVDEIPDVRATTAKAMGNLVGGIGETAELVEIVPWLIVMLSSEESPVERSGAAQGLAEVCYSLSEERMGDILQQLLLYKNNSNYCVREGLFWMLSSLPGVVQEAYAPYVEEVLPVILDGMMDTAESVREIALRSGQMICQFLGSAVAKPMATALTEGVSHEQWRIRHGCLELLGNLLQVLAGAGEETRETSNGDDYIEEDEEEVGGSASKEQRKIMTGMQTYLGEVLTKQVLSTLYISRTDISNTCRQSALKVWKSITNNTTEVVLDNIHEIIDHIIVNLVSDFEDVRYIVGRALNDCITKMGDHILPVILPQIASTMSYSSEEERAGMCMGLAEIFTALSKRQYQEYSRIIVPVLEQTLCDGSDQVRGHAAEAYAKLVRVAGMSITERLVMSLLDKIESGSEGEEEYENATLGLKNVLTSRPRDVMDYLLPIVLHSPISLRNAHILENVLNVCGKPLVHYIGRLFHSLINEMKLLSNKEGDEGVEVLSILKMCVKEMMTALKDSSPSDILYEISMHIQVDNQDSNNKRWGFYILEHFIRNTSMGLTEELTSLLKYTLPSIIEESPDLLVQVHGAMSAIVSTLPMDLLVEEISFISSHMASAYSEAKHKAGASRLKDDNGRLVLPYLSIKKSFENFLSIFTYGLTGGATLELREQACVALKDTIAMTETLALKPYLSKIAGSLIRVFGDRISNTLKVNVLEALSMSLSTGGVLLKAFAPQLQTTFLKGMKDADEKVRLSAISGLEALVPVCPASRIDTCLSELSNQAVSAEEDAVMMTYLIGVHHMLLKLAAPPSEACQGKIDAALSELPYDTIDDDKVDWRSECAQALETAAKLMVEK